MKIKCPACAAVLNIPESAAGKVVKCPCGKQLRAPGGAAAKPASQTRPASAGPARSAGQTSGAASPSPRRPASPAGGAGGFDAAMFDELTDQDLKPVTTAGRPQTKAAAAPARGTLLQQYAPPSDLGYQSSGSRVIAGAGARLLGRILDSLFIAVGFGLGFGGAVVLSAIVGEAEEVPDAIAYVALALVAAGASVPILINTVLIVKSGQTLGKKAVGTRIVLEATGHLPGFMQGVLVRSWVFYTATQIIPFLGLIDALFVFSENARTLHDRLAGTIVINA